MGSRHATVTATVTITTAGMLGQINVLTQGAANKDYALVSGGTCATGTAYTANQTCTAEFTFTPSRPGQRPGAISLTSASSPATVLGTAFVYGMGTGPLAAFPGSTTIHSLASGFNDPYGVAVDGSGNVYVPDNYTNKVEEIVAVNGVIPANPKILPLGTGFSSPSGVAVDGSGNVYVPDALNKAVKEIVAVNGVVPSRPTILTLGSGFNVPTGVAVDGSGNVYVADSGSGAVKEIVAVNGVVPSSPTILTLASGLGSPFGVAVDGSGNVYFADAGNNAVEEIAAVNGAMPPSPAVLILGSGSGLSSPHGVAVDGSGNVYFADTRHNAVKEIVAVNGAIPPSPTVLTLASGLGSPSGVAVDGSGGVFVSGFNISTISEIDLTKAPALTFATTATGQTSTDSPKSVTVQNMGNQPLTFSSIAASTNFASSSTGTCSTSTPLAESGTCTVAASFTPTTAGSPDTGTLTLTDNSLNAASSTQSVQLSGTATPGASTTTVVQPATATYNPASQMVLLSATVMAGTSPATGGTVTFTVLNGSKPIGAAVTSGALSGGTATASYTLPAGTDALHYTIQAVYSGGAGFAASTSSPQTLTVNGAALTVTAKDATRVYNTANPVFSGTVTGALGGDTFTESFTTAATISSNAGTYSIVPSVTGTNLANYTVTITNGTLTIAQAGSVTELATNTSSDPSVQNATLTATVTPAVGFTGTPTGKVSFYSGSTLLAKGIPLVTGVATYTSTTLTQSDLAGVKATYLGDTNFTGSSVQQTFTMTSNIPGTVDIQPGQEEQYAATITSAVETSSTFPTFQVDGTPPGSSVTIAQDRAVVGSIQRGVIVPVVISDGTASPLTKGMNHTQPAPGGRRLAPVALAFLLLFGIGGLRKRGRAVRRLLCVLLLVATCAAATLMNGCGSHAGYFTQTPQSYPVTITATSGNVQNSITFTLTVE